MRRSIAIILALGAAFAAAGCGGRIVSSIRCDTVWVGNAAGDSLGLDDFLRLPAPSVAARRERAAIRVARAERADGVVPRVRNLCTAAGLAPDDADVWLRLSEETSRLGDVRRALAHLDRAEETVRTVPPEGRRALRLRLARARAWLLLDRGCWAEAHAWADSASRYAPGERESRMLLGLTRAAHGDANGALHIARDIERLQYFRFEWRWIRGRTALAEGHLEEAYHWMHDARPDGPWAARFHRDMALICERLGNRSAARRHYGYNLAALDLEPEACGDPVEVRIRREDGRTDRVPVWWALGRLPAAGSHLGAALAAVDSFRVERSPTESAAWGDIAQELLSECIRRDLDVLRCRRERGLLYAEMGFDELALGDLDPVVADLAARDLVDPELFALYGHLLNGDRRHREALSVLQQAVDTDPELARAWSSLGFSLIKTARESDGQAALERALALDPDLPEAWYNLGLSHYFAHRWTPAAEAFERALDLAPDNPDILPLLQQSRGRARRAARDTPETP